ncbi:hypothetical protein [Aquifex aeolicus]|uniref:hypothetical protein n=1 Tax=Aquifex aeolicus TaxID=63363 RepID=UPI00030ECDA1|nr:hypothetical protein [Aquifex aeolicus]
MYVKSKGGNLRETEGLKKVIGELLSRNLITEEMKAKLKEELILTLEMEPSRLAELVNFAVEEVILLMVKELRNEGEG